MLEPQVFKIERLLFFSYYQKKIKSKRINVNRQSMPQTLNPEDFHRRGIKAP